MSRLIETIKVDTGRFLRLHYHQMRIDRSQLDLFQLKNGINISTEISNHQHPKTGIFKCRIIYEKQLESIEFLPYEPKKVESLKVVHDQSIEYSYKYEDRTNLDALFNQRQFCDDVLIVKSGMVTDSSYSNVIFFDGYKWITPNTPLLRGTMRQFLLEAAEIKEQPIAVQDIPSFKSFAPTSDAVTSARSRHPKRLRCFKFCRAARYPNILQALITQTFQLAARARVLPPHRQPLFHIIPA